MKKKSKLIIIMIGIICLVIAGIILFAGNKKEQPVPEAKTVDNIKAKEFDYKLYDNKSSLYKDYFAKLKEELLKDNVDDLEYAKIISELFVVDFYSLSDKKTNTDVGGLDFIYPDMKDNFVLKATDTMYKYVESNVYGDRKQELPSVKSIEIINFDIKSVKTDELNDENGYSGTIKLTYEKEMGYPKEVNLTLVHSDKKIYVVEVK